MCFTRMANARSNLWTGDFEPLVWKRANDAYFMQQSQTNILLPYATIEEESEFFMHDKLAVGW